MGGTCKIFPRKRERAASTSTRDTATGRSSSTSPEVSWVLVTTPSRIPATYSFRLVSANSTARVACPTKTGSTPVAMGSKVPPCPTRFSRRMPRILAHTSMLVHPAGLLTIKIPSGIPVPLFSAAKPSAAGLPRKRRNRSQGKTGPRSGTVFHKTGFRRGPPGRLVDDQNSIRHRGPQLS